MFFKKNHKVGVGAVFKNEFPYILEWVAWYVSQGFEKIIIVDNESDDGSYELLKKLESLGLIDLYSIASQNKVQIAAYNLIIDKCKNSLDLIAFVDADEFIVPEGAQTSVDFICEAFKDKKVGALGINWRVFGTSWLKNYSDEFVIKRFLMAANDTRMRNHYIKSVYRLNAVDSIFPHRANLKRNYKYINCSFNQMYFGFLEGKEIKQNFSNNSSGLSLEICDSGLRVNHYALKSEAEFIKKKFKGDSMLGVDHVKSSSYFEEFDLNDFEWHMPEIQFLRFKDTYDHISQL